jgi:hypothetical protein
MTVQITRGGYGFGHDWTLIAFGKSFYLGQDVKFCSRVLSMDPREVVSAIGTDKLYTEAGRKKLARLIVSELGLNRSNVKSIEPWGLCAQ